MSTVGRRPTLGQLLVRAYQVTGISRARRELSGLVLRWNGGKVKNRAGNTLFVDASDLRGRRLRLRRGALDEAAVALWSHLCGEREPDLVLDVGCNYGEVALSRNYRPGTILHLVEANEKIHPFLDKSLSKFRGDARLLRGAASDSSGTLPFAVDNTSSGLSRVVIGGDQVRSFRLSDVVDDGGHLAFKIDVEGHEIPVLRGMEDLLRRVDSFTGMCEAVRLDESDWSYLLNRFRVEMVVLDRGRIQFLPIDAVPSFRASRLRMRATKDVVLRAK